MSTLAHTVSGGDSPDRPAEPPLGPPVSPATNAAPPPSAPTVRPLDEQELRTLPLQALLVRTGAVTIEQLSDALRVNVATGRAVEDIAIERGWVTADVVHRLVAAKQAAMGEVPAATPEAAQTPPPSPPAAPVAATPAPAAEPVAPPVASTPAPAAEPIAPRAAPAPVAVVSETDDVDPADGSVGVFLNLADGERVWVGRYANEQEAEQRALEVVQQFVRPEPGVWPRISGRFVRPEAVVSVELSPRKTP